MEYSERRLSELETLSSSRLEAVERQITALDDAVSQLEPRLRDALAQEEKAASTAASTPASTAASTTAATVPERSRCRESSRPRLAPEGRKRQDREIRVPRDHRPRGALPPPPAGFELTSAFTDDRADCEPLRTIVQGVETSRRGHEREIPHA